MLLLGLAKHMAVGQEQQEKSLRPSPRDKNTTPKSLISSGTLTTGDKGGIFFWLFLAPTARSVDLASILGASPSFLLLLRSMADAQISDPAMAGTVHGHTRTSR